MQAGNVDCIEQQPTSFLDFQESMRMGGLVWK